MDKRHCDGPGCDAELLLEDVDHASWLVVSPIGENYARRMGEPRSYWEHERHFCTEDHLRSRLLDARAPQE